MANPQPDEFAEATTWRPDQGEHPVTISGRLTRVGSVKGAYGAYPLVEIEQDDGKLWAFHAFRDMAREELTNLGPQVGDRIEIRYGGRSDKGYYRYRARSLDGKQAEVDWSRFGADRSPAAEQSDPQEPPPAGEPDSAAVADDEEVPF